jgi:hypothetical protein
MTGKKENNQMYFPFMSHHQWYGFQDYQDLMDFLEDGAYEGDVIIDAEDVKQLPPPQESNSNGDARKTALVNHRGHPIKNQTGIKARARGNVITEIAVPVKKEEPKVTEERVKVTPVIDNETAEILAEDQAYGGNGG